MATNENLPPNVIRQLAKELKNLDEAPPEGIKIIINDDDFTTISADIEGPAGTPYENGIFRMKLLLSHEFPHSPPKGYFITKIFHPNIATNGEICVNTLKKDWNPSLGLRHVLAVVRCLLIEPFPESALNEQAGKMLLENYEEYARHARLYTSIHALKPKPKVNVVKKLAVPEPITALNVDKSKTVSNVTMPLADNQLAAPAAAAAAASNPPATNGQVPLSTSGQSGGAEVAPKEVVVVETLPVVKKEEGLRALKPPQMDKKKIDARKKALKRL